MRILVFSQAAWNTANAFGNTVTNWFDGWEDTQFFHFYARQQKPNTDIVKEYYHVSAIDILQSALRGGHSGKILNASDIKQEGVTLDNNIEQQRIAKLHKNTNELLYWCMEKVWRSEKWLNNNFDAFVQEANPDIIFAFATSPYILEPAIKHIKAMKPNVKIVLWVADDILSEFENNAWYRRYYLKSSIDYCFNISDKLYGASVEMCEKYSRVYKKDIKPLYKGCSFDRQVKEKRNEPLNMVYAGNLLYGRHTTIKEIIEALKIINADKRRVVLEVYSNTPIDELEKDQYYDNTNAFYMGARSYEEIKKIQNNADLVLHVESFESGQMEKVKYSFSTKIIDCLQSGSVVIGIGPSKSASIEYLRKVNGAIVIDDPLNIYKTLVDLIHEKDILLQRAFATREYAIENHEIVRVRQKLRDDFLKLIHSSQQIMR